jgi:hypothetical protein
MTFYIKKDKLNKNKLLYQPIIDKSVISNHINSNTINRLSGKTPEDRLIYSSQNPHGGTNGAGTWVRNNNCWLNGISNISCFSPAQISGHAWNQFGGTLITKKHVLFAKHFLPTILPNGGTPIIFVDENNNAIKRNIIQYGNDATDITIALLDDEVSNNIKIAKILPIDFNNYISGTPISNSNTSLKGFSLDPQLYCVALDQEEKAILKIFNFIGLLGLGSQPNIIWYQLFNGGNVTGQYANFTESIVVGDSGNPVFIIIDNELVILTSWWTPSTGPFITGRYNEVNAIIENLSPGQGYSLTPINLLSVYNKYK